MLLNGLFSNTVMLSGNDSGYSQSPDDSFFCCCFCLSVVEIGAFNCIKSSTTAHATCVYPGLNLSMVLRGQLLWKCTDCSQIMETASKSDNDRLSNIESVVGNIQTELLEIKQLINQTNKEINKGEPTFPSKPLFSDLFKLKPLRNRRTHSVTSMGSNGSFRKKAKLINNLI